MQSSKVQKVTEWGFARGTNQIQFHSIQYICITHLTVDIVTEEFYRNPDADLYLYP